jgi:hypothetical protein
MAGSRSHCTAPHPLTAGSKQDMTPWVRETESGVRKSSARVVKGDFDRRQKQAGARREGSPRQGKTQRLRLDAFFTEYDTARGTLVAIWPCPWTFLLSQRLCEAGTMGWDMLACSCCAYACIQLSLSCHSINTFSSHTPLASHAAALLISPDMTTPRQWAQRHNTKTSRIPAYDPRRWSPSVR